VADLSCVTMCDLCIINVNIATNFYVMTALTNNTQLLAKYFFSLDYKIRTWQPHENLLLIFCLMVITIKSMQ
jgi:hypothetical protein